MDLACGQIFPTKLMLVTEMIDRWLTTASNPLRIHDMKQKYSSHLRHAENDGKFERWQAVKLQIYGKTDDGSVPICSNKAWCSTERFSSWRAERRPIPLHCAAAQEVAEAVSLTGVWLYIPSLCWPEASPLTDMGNIEPIVHRKVIGRRNKKNILA